MVEQLGIFPEASVKDRMYGNWHLKGVKEMGGFIIQSVSMVIRQVLAAYVIMIIVHLQWVVEVQLAQKMFRLEPLYLRYAVQV
jgi:hypothetical protein